MCLHLHHIQSACIRIWIWLRLAVLCSPCASLLSLAPAATALERARICFLHPKDVVLTPLLAHSHWLVFISSIFVIICSSSSLLPAPRFPRRDDLRIWTCAHPYAQCGGTLRDLSSLPYHSPCLECLHVCWCCMVQGIGWLNKSVPGHLH
jgi:hypothetical protein